MLFRVSVSQVSKQVNFQNKIEMTDWAIGSLYDFENKGIVNFTGCVV